MEPSYLSMKVDCPRCGKSVLVAVAGPWEMDECEWSEYQEVTCDGCQSQCVVRVIYTPKLIVYTLVEAYPTLKGKKDERNK